ncbi:MAG TPA: MarR family transcriptional regulator, partial [Erysipelotrichaceae bacterium]|nr:MarR family transcriptional regulator [Erysipelotrichaceae bacterium]
IAPLVEHERRMLEKMGLENARALIELTTQYVKLLKTIEEEEQHAN